LDGSDGRFKKLDICVSGGIIAALCENRCEPGDIDASGLFVIPGFIDTHIHGSVAVEFASPEEDFEKARVWLAKQGITAFAATVRALPADRTVAAIKNIVRESKKESSGARVAGIHLEGPFVSKERAGAMNPPDETCRVETVNSFAEAAQGLLKIMTIAPERENALEVIKYCAENGINASLGHTNADYETAMAAIEAGAARATHVFNAMRPFSHRGTGILGAVLTDPRVNCELICDLVHNDAPTVKMVYRLKGCEGVTVVSDTGYMSGLGDGEFTVDGRTRYVKNGVCTNKEGRIAGSTVSMLAGVKNLRRLGVPLEEISVMASANPARALGLQNVTGSIKPGYYADLAVCDGEMNVKAAAVGGKIVFSEI
ncbi:MAG: N-acetylglucosamine-6-phosphate deacetylase, partial [Clostridia bacterium]|nr:N-acetylglucosamine-6-phosphate deacetylase [Clostridia bacterium]